VVIYQISINPVLDLTVQSIKFYLSLAALMLVLGGIPIAFYIKLKRTKNKDFTPGPQIKKISQKALLLWTICFVIMASMFIYNSYGEIKNYYYLKHGIFSTYRGTIPEIVRFSGNFSNQIPLEEEIKIKDGVYRIVLPQDVILVIETDNYIPFKNTEYEIYYLPGSSGIVMKVVELNSN